MCEGKSNTVGALFIDWRTRSLLGVLVASSTRSSKLQVVQVVVCDQSLRPRSHSRLDLNPRGLSDEPDSQLVTR